MPIKDAVRRVVVRGTETRALEVEDYANFLRDVVFLHDRVWILSHFEAPDAYYYSSYFYSRDRRRVPEEYSLRLVSATIGSPFELNIKINFGESFQNAAKALIDLLRAGATLGEFIKQEKLRTRAVRAIVRALEKSQQHALEENVAVVEAIRALRSANNSISDEQLYPLLKDALRLAQSPLQIQSVGEEAPQPKREE